MRTFCTATARFAAIPWRRTEAASFLIFCCSSEAHAPAPAPPTQPGTAREVYARAVDFFGDDNLSPKLFADFAKFEEMEKEVCFVAMT